MQRRSRNGKGWLICVGALLLGTGAGFALHRLVPAIAAPFNEWMTKIRR